MNSNKIQLPPRSENVNLHASSTEELMDDDDFDEAYLDDEPMRKPKGKKIKKMRLSFDK